MTKTQLQCGFCATTIYRRASKSGWVFCNIACKSAWQKQQKPVTKEWLEQKYLVEKLSMPEIGKLVKRDPSRVEDWLKDFGIQTRPRGLNTETQFKLGGSGWAGRRHSEESKEKIRQARIREGSVPYLKNGIHHLKGKRGAETTNWKGGATPERQAFYSSIEWKRAVSSVWKRDNATCQKCLLDFRRVDRNVVSFHIHHIVSFAVRELRCELSNLILLCNSCHRWVHSRANVNKEFINESSKSA